MSAPKVVMVTGGTGLVGKAIQEVIEAENNVDEKWIYLSSKVSAVEKPKSATDELLARRLENQNNTSCSGAPRLYQGHRAFPKRTARSSLPDSSARRTASKKQITPSYRKA